MALLNSNRSLGAGNAPTVEMTDDLYNELSVGQQFIAKTAEALGITVQIAEYEGRHFVHRETIEAADAAIFAAQEAGKKAVTS